MEDNQKSNRLHGCWCCGHHTKKGNTGWGILFLVLGGYFLAQDLGYIANGVSLWPIILTAFGLYLIVRSSFK